MCVLLSHYLRSSCLQPTDMQPNRKGWIQLCIFGWKVECVDADWRIRDDIEIKLDPQFQSVNCGATLQSCSFQWQFE